ncbi:MAG: hypothetical protein H0U73_10620 [Tatlockia sp.]|nr:hypothetical protein [Tatlockia sp.]
MLSNLAFILPLLVIIGYSFFFSSIFNTSLSLCIVSATSFIGVLEFLFAISNYLQVGSSFLLITGLGLFVFFSLRDLLYVYPKRRLNWLTITYFLVFSFFLALFVWGLRFGLIDDYSFWGTMSKYLFTFRQLPSNTDFIIHNFLTYIPGMACFHYLFYFALGKYSQFLGYFAQGIVLLSTLMVLFDAKKIQVSLYRMAIAFIFLSIGFGTVFARMQVDALVAAFVFVIVWMIFRKQQNDHYFLFFFPILFLSLIKEIGFLFAIMCIVALLVTRSNKKALLYGLLSLLGVLALKWIWIAHCKMYGFQSFSQGVSLTRSLDALNPFNSYYHAAKILFIKAIFLESFGHVLAWPNLVSYLGLALIWHRLSKAMGFENYRVALQLRGVFLCTMGLYLIMLYLLQAIVFDLGNSQKHVLDFGRYFNMLLIPFTLFSILLYYDEKSEVQVQSFKQALPITVTSIFLIFLISGKVEKTYKYYLPTIYPIVETLNKQLPNSPDWTLCLKEPPGLAYELAMPLVYFYMPHRVIVLNDNISEKGCDYVLTWPNEKFPAQVQLQTMPALGDKALV